MCACYLQREHQGIDTWKKPRTSLVGPAKTILVRQPGQAKKYNSSENVHGAFYVPSTVYTQCLTPVS